MNVEFRSKITENTSQRNLIIPIEELINYIEPLSDCYRSLFLFNGDMVEHVKSAGSVSGFRGNAFADKLVFDMDNQDLSKAQQDAQMLITKLGVEYGIKENEIGIYFSGHKGFAIELLTTGLYGFNQCNQSIPLFLKKVCLFLAREFSSWDSVIYNTSRLFRLNNTRHQKLTKLGGIETNLFKVALTKEMLFTQSSEDIKRYATKPRIAFEINPIAAPEKLNIDVERIFNGLVIQPKSTPISVPSYTCDESKCPKGKKLCIWKLEQGLCNENWDNALLILAVEDRKQGLPKDVSKAKLTGILNIMNQRASTQPNYDPMPEDTIDRLINQAYNNNYDFGCKNNLLSALCGSNCFLHKAKTNMSNVGTISLLEAYQQSTIFFKNYYENLIPTGIKILDDNMPMFKGTCNLLVGAKGVGKTSLVLNIMKNMAKLQIPTIFFNLDMSEDLAIAKLGSIILADIAQKPVISTKDFMEAHTKQIFNGDFQKKLAELSEWVSISSTRGLSVKDIMEEIDNQEKLRGKHFKLIVIDHLQLLDSASTKEYEKHTQNARLFSELAKTRNVCVLGLSHAVMGDDGRLLAKGSRAWEEEAHSQINCYRPFQHKRPDKDHYMMLQLEKNRLGTTDTFELYYDGMSGWIRTLTAEEMAEVDRIKQELSEKKERKY